MVVARVLHESNVSVKNALAERNEQAYEKVEPHFGYQRTLKASKLELLLEMEVLTPLVKAPVKASVEASMETIMLPPSVWIVRVLSSVVHRTFLGI